MFPVVDANPRLDDLDSHTQLYLAGRVRKDKQTGTYNTQQYEQQIGALDALGCAITNMRKHMKNLKRYSKAVDQDEEFFQDIKRRKALEQAYMAAENNMWNNTRYATDADMDLLLKTLTPTFFSEL
ncbi:hypothetical protein M8C21_026490, partial [Ambrosia artemisiifolia]